MSANIFIIENVELMMVANVYLFLDAKQLNTHICVCVCLCVHVSSVSNHLCFKA